jgi:hypothetical protein
VLEHIEHDVEELSQVKRLLKKGGHIIVYSPALPVLMSDFDRSIGHYHRYTRKSVTSKMEKAGYTVQHFRYVDFLGTFLWFIKFKVLKSKVLGQQSVALFDSLVVPIMAKMEHLISIPFGKNVFIVGSKP